ncbi:MAG: NAD(P)/FAD-dependent oxidoreductase [Eubacterium sp.]|nr:NAD(P)/FAD-dependent oxidoreductase [Eubacterium sp.]
MKRMIVVGGGAAGMMTAIHASKKYKVTLLEKNDKLGKKLFITGKGRCNLTNACDEETFLKNVMSNPKFLYSAVYAYPPSAVMESFEAWGLKIKTERGNRVFPCSDHSSDVIRTLEQEMKRCRVEVRLNTRVTGLVTEAAEGKNEGERSDARERKDVAKLKDAGERSDAEAQQQETDAQKGPDEMMNPRVTGVRLSTGEVCPADVVVLATGGISYPGTGASGEGVGFLEKLGLRVRPFQPSLVPFLSDESVCKAMMGLSLKNVEVKFFRAAKPKKPVYSEFGEMLFTHFGVSGPIILSASGRMQKYFKKEEGRQDYRPSEELYMTIDWKPALSPEQLDARILRDFEQGRNRELANAMGQLLPSSAITPVLTQAGLDPKKKVNEVTKEERQQLLDTLKSFRLPILGLRGFDEAIISAGGLSVKELDPKTMEVKAVSGLRVVGEMMDCDALTGGFNLQIAWCTAFLAAE